jgi:hypothetical protein
MSMVSANGNVRCESLVDALRAEFGCILAQQILESEALDFLWDARLAEHYLGQHMDGGCDVGTSSLELSRIVILSRLQGRWNVALCLVDGDGSPVALLWKREFDRRDEAEFAFDRGR